jgi:hypothetical protein
MQLAFKICFLSFIYIAGTQTTNTKDTTYCKRCKNLATYNKIQAIGVRYKI